MRHFGRQRRENEGRRRDFSEDGRSGRRGDSDNLSDEPIDSLNGYDLPPLPGEPIILSRNEHNISRKNIDPDAIKVMARLIRYGHRAFFVGGGVRDLLLDRQPKDFDIGTDAKPEEIRQLFRNSRIIGRRFRINHVFFSGNKIFEVTTFRASSEADPDPETLLIRSDNTYGDPQTDALRRDLTINGLFYDLSTFSVIDYVGGIEDLKNKIIRIIGDPDTRIEEDPVRMIRAIRHAARISFTIEPRTYESICRNSALIKTSSGPRVFEELVRELRGGNAVPSFRLLRECGLLPYLLPSLCEAIDTSGSDAWGLLERTLHRIDLLTKSSGDELPLAVVFLSLFIGSYHSKLVDAPCTDEQAQIIESTLSLWPLLEQSEESEINDDESGGDRTDQARRIFGGPSRRVRIAALEICIEAIFRPLGVARKDRERMSQLLMGRLQLILCYQQGTFDRNLLNRSWFPEAFLLLALTADMPELRACVEWWRERSRENEEHHSKRRTGRRGKSNVGHRPRRL